MARKILIAVCMACSLTACSSVGNSALQDRAALDSIVAKQTTAAQVRDRLGQPAHVSTDVGGDVVWGYRLSRGNLFGEIRFTSVILQIHDGVVVGKDVSEFGS